MQRAGQTHSHSVIHSGTGGTENETEAGVETGTETETGAGAESETEGERGYVPEQARQLTLTLTLTPVPFPREEAGPNARESARSQTRNSTLNPHGKLK